MSAGGFGVVGYTTTVTNAQPTAADISANFVTIFGESIDEALSTPTLAVAGGSSVPNPLYNAAIYTLQLESTFNQGMINFTQVSEALYQLAGPTSGLAMEAYQFFTGGFPSQAGLDFLVDPALNPNGLGGSHYAPLNELTRFETFSVGLGTGTGAGAPAFAAAYGPLTFDQAVRQAYNIIIGNSAAAAAGLNVDAAVAYIDSQQAYFQGVGGGTDIGAKAAMAGYLMELGFEGHLGNAFNAAEVQLVGALQYRHITTVTPIAGATGGGGGV